MAQYHRKVAVDVVNSSSVMPFMKGREAFRRTMQYLQQGRITFKHDVKVMMINYNIGKKFKSKDTSEGIRDVVFWHLAQIQFKNPQVQVVTFKNMTPSPFITFILGDGKKILVDVEGKTKEDIMDHVRKIFGKTDLELRQEEELVDQAKFGMGAQRYCICEVPGQVPCPGFVPLPKHMTGKYKEAVRKGEIEPEPV